MSAPVVSVDGVGVQFALGRRHQSLKDLLLRRPGASRPGSFWALRDVSFDITAGETIGVVGRNGEGKSTLLKLIAGVMLPDRGSVHVRAGVAPLIEITGGFVSELTVRDNISLTAGLHGMSRSRISALFDEIVDFAEIEEFLDTPYKHLSSGMKVRVAFAVVSRLEEPVILVDEVLAVGDRVFKRKCHARIEELTAEGRTLFLVSHSDSDLRRFCKRGIYLRQGRVVADGPMDDVLSGYAADNEDES